MGFIGDMLSNRGSFASQFHGITGRTKKSKTYKVLQTIAIIGMFIIAALLILGIMGIIKLGANLFTAMGLIFVLCMGCLMALPWANYLSNKMYKVVSIVFLVITAVCCILWIIVVVMLRSIISSLGAETFDEARLWSLLNFIKVATMITIQFITATYIATCIIRYKKTMIVFQVISYIGVVFLDIYGTLLINCLVISGSSISINQALGSFLFSRIMFTILLFAIAFAAIANIALSRNLDRKMKESLISSMEKQERAEEKAEKNGTGSSETEGKESAEVRLEKLKKAYESDLITKEEYEKKREEILKDL